MFFPFSSMSLDYFRDLGSSLPPYDLVLCSLCPHPTPINAKSLPISWKEQTLCLQLIAPGMGLAGLTGFAVVVCSDWLVFVPFLVVVLSIALAYSVLGPPLHFKNLAQQYLPFGLPFPDSVCLLWGGNSFVFSEVLVC